MSYVYAIVKMPIQIFPDGNYETLSDRTHTTIEPCDKLPPINQNQTDDISEQLQKVLIAMNQKTEEHVGEPSDGAINNEMDDSSVTSVTDENDRAVEPEAEPEAEPEPELPVEPAASTPPDLSDKSENSSVADVDPVNIKLILDEPKTNKNKSSNNNTFRNTSKMKPNTTKKSRSAK